MKAKLLIMAIGIFSLVGLQQLIAQEVKTEKFKVYGSCDLCKARIEKAAISVAGVNKATWSMDTKIMNVSFDQTKTNTDAIQKAIAAVGHDTEKYRADDKTYEALPACCHYERSKK